MKKTILLLTTLFLLFITGCSNSDNKQISDTNNEIIATPVTDKNNYNEKNESFINNFNDYLNLFKFNSNLTDYEKKYLQYYEDKYPNSKIYFMKTNVYLCDGCYDIYYKKDREILKIKIYNNKITQETKIKTELNLYIESEDMCKLFGGKWNTCPKICPTDEKICMTECAPATCEFEGLKIILKKENEICGGIDKGDCEYGLTCYYKTQNETYGSCRK